MLQLIFANGHLEAEFVFFIFNNNSSCPLYQECIRDKRTTQLHILTRNGIFLKWRSNTSCVSMVMY